MKSTALTLLILFSTTTFVDMCAPVMMAGNASIRIKQSESADLPQAAKFPSTYCDKE